MDTETVAGLRRARRCSTSWPPSTPRRRRRAGRRAGRAAAHRRRRRHRRLRRHRLQELDPLPAAPDPSPGSVCPTSRTTATRSTPRSWRPTRSTSRGCSRLVYGGDADCRRPPRGSSRWRPRLAAAHWDVVKRRDADLTYNLRTFADLPVEAPGFDWAVGSRAGRLARAGRGSCRAPARRADRVRRAVVRARTSRTGDAGCAGA